MLSWSLAHPSFLSLLRLPVVVSIVVCSVLVVSDTLHVQAAAKPPELGISTSSTLLDMNDKDLDSRMRDMKNLGATWIRVDFNWPVIQPSNPNIYHWAKYDRVVRVAGVHRLKILGIIDYTPIWAQEPRCARLVITKAAGQKCNPKNTQTFGRFARAISLRYKNKSVRAWELWNEPNLSSYWKTAQPGPQNAVHADAVAYANFANAGAAQIRQNAPGTLIITGGLGPLFEPKYPKGIRQSEYLAKLLGRLKYSLFDGIGIHPYSWPLLPTDAQIYNAFYTVDHGPDKYNLRTIMIKAGWGEKPLWATEFGASTKGVNGTTNPTPTSRPDHVSETVQARIIAQGIRGWQAKKGVGPLFVHADSDQWLPKAKNEGGFGMRRSNGTQKPSYGAFKEAVK